MNIIQSKNQILKPAPLMSFRDFRINNDHSSYGRGIAIFKDNSAVTIEGPIYNKTKIFTFILGYPILKA